MHIEITQLWNGTVARRSGPITVDLHEGPTGLTIHLNAPYYADPAPEHPMGPTPELWGFEVVEVFIAGPGEPVPYTEIEIGPHGHHLVLTLLGVRSPRSSGLPMRVRCTRAHQRWTATAQIDAEHLPPRPWRINATAIHGIGKDRRYLSATPLKGATPDFHQPECFIPWRD